MKNIRIVHSFWTKPMISEDCRWEVPDQLKNNIWVLTLSVLYAKRNEGIYLVLYTDNLGYELLKDLPYDEIHKDLEDIPKNNGSEVLWAQGKFYAMKNEPLGSIHTDYDVFIKTNKCVDELWEINNHDLIVQDTEFANGKDYDEIREILNNIGIPINERYAYNCGVVGFNNQELKDKYFNDYFRYQDIVKSNYIKGSIKKQCYDLSLEQENLYRLSKKFKVKTILGLKRWSKYDEYNKRAILIGYQHLIGGYKYRHLDIVENYIKSFNEDLYNKTIDKIDNSIIKS